MMQKARLNLPQMINLNLGFLGIQFGWGLQMTNMSGIYKFLGATSSQVGYLWIFAPLTGMLIQPILGQLSDRTWVTWLGRRRPYILLGAFLSVIALILMPHSTSLFMAASLLFLLDSSVNIAMHPYRALVADVASEVQHSKCYAIQVFLVGIGGTLAASLPWVLLHVFKITEHNMLGEIPLSIRLSFYIGAMVFLLANLWTVLFSKEYPPANMEAWEKYKKNYPLQDPFKFISQICTSFICMPKLMREISYVQFFTWMAWFSVFLYFSLSIAQNIFGLPLDAKVNESVSYGKIMEQAVTIFGLCYAAYTIVSTFYALIVPRISKLITRKGTHIFSLICGMLALIASNYIHSQLYLFIAMIGVGIAWTSTNLLPYAMLASALPEEKMGLYMGIFNITICIPQIIASLLLGFISLHVFHGRAASIITLGGISFLIAAVLTFFVHDKKIEEEVI